MSGPPTGPPPSQVPDGWLAKFDPNHKTFYYVNLATGASQWEKPASDMNRPAEIPPPYNPRQHPQEQQQQPQQQQQRGFTGGGPQGMQGMQGGGYPSPYSPGPGYGGYPQQMPYGYQQPPGQMYQQMPPQQMQQAQRRGGGMSPMGGAALGAGAGLLGAMIIGRAMQPDVKIENHYYGDDMCGDDMDDDDFLHISTYDRIC